MTDAELAAELRTHDAVMLAVIARDPAMTAELKLGGWNGRTVLAEAADRLADLAAERDAARAAIPGPGPYTHPDFPGWEAAVVTYEGVGPVIRVAEPGGMMETEYDLEGVPLALLRLSGIRAVQAAEVDALRAERDAAVARAAALAIEIEMLRAELKPFVSAPPDPADNMLYAVYVTGAALRRAAELLAGEGGGR